MKERGEGVRYLGMDSPEVDEPFYSEARQRNAALAEKKKVRLLICDRRDKYGRLLAWVYSGDELVNETLLKEGLARVLTIPPCGVEKAGLFKKDEIEAKRNNLGLWGDRGSYISYRKALKRIKAEDAGKYEGQEVKITARITKVRERDRVIFMDMKGGLSILIYKDDSPDFKTPLRKDPSSFAGRTVTVSGIIKLYRGRPEIIINWPWQFGDDSAPWSLRQPVFSQITYAGRSLLS